MKYDKFGFWHYLQNWLVNNIVITLSKVYNLIKAIKILIKHTFKVS